MHSREEIISLASETYEKLQFRDDFLFCKILESNPDIAKEILEMILEVKIREVQVEKQAAIEITADGSWKKEPVLSGDAGSEYDQPGS